MNVILLLLGLILTAVAVALVARSFITARLRTADMLGSIGHYGFAGEAFDFDPPAGVRAFLDDLATSLGSLLLSRLQFGSEDYLRRQLVQAGLYRMTPRMLRGYQLLFAVGLPALWIWLAAASGQKPAIGVLIALLAAGIGWAAPAFIVRRKAEARLYRIDYDMPELIDLLVVTVEAGLGLNASLNLASGRISGPLGEELRICIQEQRMGLTSLQALENMVSRCPTPAMRSFVRAMIQGERLGVSVGQILRSLALEMRKRRRAAAEEKAQKAPLKILFPLIFMIFPAMFVVILGPAIIGIVHALGGK
jgi:tight adherence protein C